MIDVPGSCAFSLVITSVDADGKLRFDVGGLNTATRPPNRDALQMEPLKKNVAVGNFMADVYLARTTGGVEKYRSYMGDTSDVPGGRTVRHGIGGVMDEGIVTMLNGEDFKDRYPVAIDDLQRGTRTDVTKASDVCALLAARTG